MSLRLFRPSWLVSSVICSVQNTDPVHVLWPIVTVFCGSRFHFSYMLRFTDTGGWGRHKRKLILELFILQVLVTFPIHPVLWTFRGFQTAVPCFRVFGAFPGRWGGVCLHHLDWRAEFCKELWLTPPAMHWSPSPSPGRTVGLHFPASLVFTCSCGPVVSSGAEGMGTLCRAGPQSLLPTCRVRWWCP